MNGSKYIFFLVIFLLGFLSCKTATESIPQSAESITQLVIPRVDEMPNMPAPYMMKDWKKTALEFDKYVYNFDEKGPFMPMIWMDTMKRNFPQNTYGLYTALGDVREDGKLKKYRVVTIQFSIDLFEGPMFQKERFYRIRKMLDNSIRGIKFEGDVFKTAMTKMLSLTKDKGFTNILEFIDLLDLLSKTQSITYLASEGFTPATLKWESKRIQQAYNYIIKNFSETKFKLNDVAALINMSESAFSHFFRKYTNKSFTEFLTDVRIGHTCKLLLSTDETISQIAYRSGFNNIANFNRLFKKNKNCTPLEYRQRHKEKTIYDWQEEINMWQFLPPNSKNLDMVGPAINTTKVTHI